WVAGGAYCRRARCRGSPERVRRPCRVLLLLPAAAALVPPAAAGTGHPLPREDLADVAFPLRMAVGDGDFAVDRLAVAVVVGHGLLDLHPVLERQLGGVAHDDRAVAGKAERAGVEARAQGRIEPGGHPRLDRLDRRGADA